LQRTFLPETIDTIGGTRKNIRSGNPEYRRRDDETNSEEKRPSRQHNPSNSTSQKEHFPTPANFPEPCASSRFKSELPANTTPFLDERPQGLQTEIHSDTAPAPQTAPDCRTQRNQTAALRGRSNFGVHAATDHKSLSTASQDPPHNEPAKEHSSV